MKTDAKARRARVVENEGEIATVNPGAIVIVFASGDDEALPFEERSDARYRVEAGVARSQLRATNESDKQEQPTKTLSVATAVNNSPAHPRLVLAPANASACDGPLTIDKYEIAHAEFLEVVEKGREAFAFMWSEERRDVGVEHRKACITICESIGPKDHHGITALHAVAALATTYVTGAQAASLRAAPRA